MLTISRRHIAYGAAVVVLVGVGYLFIIGEPGLDKALGWTVVLLPTAMGVVCAMQTLKPPKYVHHRRWFVVFIASGCIISASVLWQQHRQQARTDAERKALQDEITQLRQLVDRSLFQIRDVAVSFLIRVPLDDPALKTYHDRIEKCAEEMRHTAELRCGTKPHFFDQTGQRKTRKDFSIPPWSQLYPQKQAEEIPYLMLNQPSVKISLFKEFRSVDAPDLSFRVGQLIDSQSNDRGGYPMAILFYDMEAKEMFIEGSRLLPIEGNWYSTGRIAAIQDLSNVWITANPGCLTPKVSPLGGDTKEYQTLRQLTCAFEKVTLFISNGWQFEFTNKGVTDVVVNKQGETCYVGKLDRVTPPFP